jgi:hypothetical protein
VFSHDPNTTHHGAALASEGEIASLLAYLGPSNQDLVQSLLTIKGIGLACIIMRDDLDRATGAMFNLDGYSHVQNRARLSAISEFGEITGHPSASDAITKVAQKTRSSMGLARLPVHCLAAQFDGDKVQEIKSYIRADRCNEYIENRRIVSDRPDSLAEIVPMLEACFGPQGCDPFNTAIDLLFDMVTAGASLELVGTDDNTSNGADVKMYFAPQAGKGSFGFDAVGADRIMRIALNACRFNDDLEPLSSYVRSMLACGLPCNLIAVGFKRDGSMETKLYFDAWNMLVERAPISVSDQAAVRAIHETYRMAGVQIEEGSAERLIKRMQAASQAVDTVSLDIFSGRRSAKIYIRSKHDAGFGVRSKDGVIA